MPIIVQKFGGTSVANVERIRKVARLVKKEVDKGNSVAVIVSAMAGETNKLVSLVGEFKKRDAREYDAVVASGEQVTCGLLALALKEIGIPARSWLSWQLGIRTDDVHSKARIAEINIKPLLAGFKKGEVAVIPGFQGVTAENRVATLGRGGSDTSAVAVAAALKADRCDIYTDVDGIYTSDPRIVPKARKLAKVGYEEMLEMASKGAKVLHPRSVELAANYNVPLQVLSSFEKSKADLPGSLLVKNEEILERRVVSGIAYDQNEAHLTLISVENVPGVAAKIFAPLAKAEINVDMIVQNVSEDGKRTDMSFTVPKGDLKKAVKALKKLKLKYSNLVTNAKVAKVSVVGIGMQAHAGVALKMFETLAAKKINILVISTSEIKISVLIDSKHMELAVRALHAAYKLEKKPKRKNG